MFLYLITFIGLPTAIAYGGISDVTTDPAPITAPFPIFMPGKKMYYNPNVILNYL